jgi:large subunit ribosomal protein L16
MAMKPSRVKWRKQQRGIMKGNATRGNKVSFGEYALQSLEPGRINGRQIEAGRMACSHYLAREGRVYIRIFPHKSFSKKPLETRMGTGKGEPDHWAAEVKPGTVLFEIAGVDETVARRAFSRVAYKMPVRCRFVKRRHTL